MSLDRRLRGLSRLGSPMMRRAIGRTLNEALTGLETAATGGGGTELTRRDEVVGVGRPRPPPRPAPGGGRRAARGARRPARGRDRAGLHGAGLACPSRGPSRTPSARPRARSSTAREDRLRRSTGRSYPDLIRLRTGRLESGARRDPAARRRRGVEAVLAACAESGVAVVPYGGGTSVVGGLDAVAGRHDAVVSLDLAHLRSVELDPRLAHRHPRPGPLAGPTPRRPCARRGRRSATSRSPSSRPRSAASPPPARRARPPAATGASTRSSPRSSSPRPTGRLRTRQTPHTAAGPPCASWSWAPRARSA